MKKKVLIHPNIDRFYTNGSEETRLNTGMGIFEFERTKTLIDNYLPDTPLTILDVGGGTGKYSAWMSQKGHRVHMVDPVLKHIKRAHKRSHQSKAPFTIHHGEARNLDFPSDFADLVLLHGPLYHLQEEAERIQALLEAKRVLKPKGILMGVAINYAASTLAGLTTGLLHQSSFFAMCIEELTSGYHTTSNNLPWILAEAHYHTPQQLKKEFTDQNLCYINTYAIEGMAWLDKNFFSNIMKPQMKETLTQLLNATQTDTNLLSISPHMLIVTSKNNYE